MKSIKFFTPFIFLFPVWIVLAAMAWFGKFENYNIMPQQGILLIAIGFTMLIIDLFIKYFIGKSNVLFVWIIEIVIIAILCTMIVPRFSHIMYV